MAWNPSPEVAVARDAANRLGAEQAVVMYVLPDGRFGYASYGKTRQLCAEAKGWADCLFEASGEYFAASSPAGGEGKEER